MNNSLRMLLIAFAFSFGFSPAISSEANTGDSFGLSPFWSWKQIETEHFRFVFPAQVSKQAEAVARIYEEAHESLKEELRWEPRAKVNVLLVDNADSANGLTTPISRFGMLLYLTPPDPFFSTDQYDDWLRLLVFHEYTHFLNMDATRGLFTVTRYIFGDVFLPNSTLPAWMLEGYAVYIETKYTKGGRGRSPYWEGVLRTIVAENALNREDYITLDQINGKHPHFPSGEVPYLFGYHLMNTVARSSGNQPLSELTERSSSRIPFFINGNVENITGKDWYQHWSDWVALTNVKMNAQLAQIRSQPVSKIEVLDETKDQSFGIAFSPDQRWVAYSSGDANQWQTLKIREWNNGTALSTIEDKFSGMGIVFTPDSKRIIYSSLHAYRNYSTFSDLRAYDLESKEAYWMTSGLRARDPDLSKDGKWIVFTEASNGGTHLVLAKIASKNAKLQLESRRRLVGTNDLDRVANPKFSPDNRGVVFSWKKNGELREGLFYYAFEKNRITALVSDESRNRFAAFNAAGVLHFVSDFSGVDNVYRYDSAGKTSLVTNTTGAIWLPSFRGNDLYASTLSKDGFSLAKVETFPKGIPIESVRVKIGDDAPASTRNEAAAAKAAAMPIEVESYSALSTMLPRQWAPFLLSSTETNYFGGQVFGYDNTFRHQYFAYGALDTTAKTKDFSIQYENRSFGPTLALFASKLTNDTLDGKNFLSGKTTYERETQFGANLSFPFQGTTSVFTPSLGYKVDRSAVYELNGTTPELLGWPVRNVPELDASLHFTNTRSSRLAVAPERGSDTFFGVRRYDLGERDIFKGIFKHVQYFNLGKHVVLFPTLKAMKANRRDLSYLDATPLSKGKRTRLLNPLYSDSFDEFGIRGYPLATFSTREVVTLSADLRIPLAQIFRGWGTNPLFFEQLSLQLFAEDTYRLNSLSIARHLPSAGVGFRLGLNALLYLPLTLGADFQHGFNKDAYGQDEIFLSVTAASLLPF